MLNKYENLGKEINHDTTSWKAWRLRTLRQEKNDKRNEKNEPSVQSLTTHKTKYRVNLGLIDQTTSWQREVNTDKV